MNRLSMAGVALLVLIFLMMSGLLDALMIFLLIGKLPYTEVYLPFEAMFIVYLSLIVVGIRAIMRLSSEGSDQHMTAAIESSPKTIKAKNRSKSSTTQKSSQNTSKTPSPKKSAAKSTRRQSAIKA